LETKTDASGANTEWRVTFSAAINCIVSARRFDSSAINEAISLSACSKIMM
jgi:hypothetical protein